MKLILYHNTGIYLCSCMANAKGININGLGLEFQWITLGQPW